MAVIGVSGHRMCRLGGYNAQSREYLYTFAKETIQDIKPSKVVLGMALGWDQAVATACVELGIPFVAAVPFSGQDQVWPSASRREYRELLSRASECINVCGGNFARWKFTRRNEWIVDAVPRLVVLWNGDINSGTGHAVEYARETKTRVTNLWNAYGEWLNAT